MKLIVGLGNPGYEYYLTPHNLGFMAVDRLAEACEVEISRPEGQSLVARTRLGSEEVILAKPMTYMNLSGLAVARLVERHELKTEDVIVLIDEADLPLGTLRIRERGSAGSHNGMKSIIGALESDRFARVRMGVKPEHPLSDRAAYVLGRFRKADLERVAEMVDRAAEAVEVMVTEGIPKAMNRFNQRDAEPPPEE